LNKIKNYREHKPNVLPEQDSIRKALTLTTGAGGTFGLLIAIIMASVHGFPVPALPYIVGIPVFCALIAGLTGICSVYINRVLMKIGVISPVIRQIIGVILVVLVAITFGLSAAAYLGFLNFKSQLSFIATIVIIGFVFGSVVTLIDHRLWKMRQQVSTLEIRNKYLVELAEKEQQIQETTKNLIITEERNRIARELHDSISQGIHGIIYAVHSLRQHLNPEDPKAMEILDHLEKTSEVTLNELKAMIMELKPSLLEERGLAEALKIHCELVARRLQIGLSLQMDPLPGLTPGQEMAIYRIVQEALANIQQHAGAERVDISLVSEQEKLTLTVRDNGKGFDQGITKAGNGLNNMEFRCRENAGTLNIATQTGVGTTIEAVFSLYVEFLKKTK
jgi:Signal transduction histidine kinase